MESCNNSVNLSTPLSRRDKVTPVIDDLNEKRTGLETSEDNHRMRRSSDPFVGTPMVHSGRLSNVEDDHPGRVGEEPRFSEENKMTLQKWLPPEFQNRERLRDDDTKVRGSRHQGRYHGGYCHDKSLLGLAEAAVLDFRHRRERKVRLIKQWKKGMDVVSDMYVFACCKYIHEYLCWYRNAKATSSTTTRDAIRLSDKTGDPLKDKILLQELVTGVRVQPDTMESVIITANKVRLDRLERCESGEMRSWVTPPLEIFTQGHRNEGCFREWDSSMRLSLEHLNLALDTQDFGEIKPTIISIPVNIDRNRWMMLDLPTGGFTRNAIHRGGSQ